MIPSKNFFNKTVLVCLIIISFLSNTEPAKADTREYVNLGLPSGLLWATCNIGASRPEQTGELYGWAETVPIRHSTMGAQSKKDQLSKDVGDITKSNKDVAKRMWGGDWRMPTANEALELVNNCKWSHTVINGVNCTKVTGPNGNSIILPAGGYFDKNSNRLVEANRYGMFLTSTRAIFKPMAVYCIGTSHNPTDDSHFILNEVDCIDGGAIRPVKGKGLLEDDSFTYKSSGKNNGRDYIDLGLSVKWATTNLGASKPWDYGSLYAWGEVKAKNQFHDNRNGWDLVEIGGTSHDAAKNNWGSSWRMPSPQEFNELINRCTWKFVCINGHYGHKVTGPNGNSIFLPLSGYGELWTIQNREQVGNYWTSKGIQSQSQNTVYYHKPNTLNANIVTFTCDPPELSSMKTFLGGSIRPVCK